MILVLNGPNLNRLGKRQPDVYGATTLPELEHELQALGTELGFTVTSKQSNHEGELVTWLQSAADNGYRGVIINPGAYTHTSIALRDAAEALAIPIIEVHISNIYAREAFRHHSFISGVATGVIAGLGTAGYHLALHRLAQLLRA